MQWTSAQIVDATQGTVRHAGELGARLDGVGIDSRRMKPGMLFVPVLAERDGHDFIAAALAAGAGGFLAMPGRTGDVGGRQGTVSIEVADTRAALANLGSAARDRLTGPVVGITGSVGKTSAKDLAAAALGTALRVAASERSNNNELGVPLTLANAPGATNVAVVEMGARRPGHIRDLCAVTRPTIGVVTAVAASHTETFGSIEGVAAAKAELIESLPASGTAVLNCDDSRVAAMAGRSAAPVLLWSAEGRPGADVTAHDVRIDDQLRASFVLRSPWGSVPVALEIRGVHQVGNALAAAAVALCCGVDLDGVSTGLALAQLSPWRMEVRPAPDGGLVVNDAYNANPTSMAAALRSLSALGASRRVAVLGAMAELGPDEADGHRRVAALAAELGIEVVALGTDLYGLPPEENMAAAATRIGSIGPGTAVLVKGSRVAGLERLAALLAPPVSSPPAGSGSG
ncbi:MAG: UDP-N-acetylmuramoyl-tripeptide--D-alanyl-D-alanine ligase [Actinomycetota bacterium]|nr:UDP-N-acetylmuramoyl-tripeptide--D-alanyl-D-alanine ligase [Actinomycetota bacterium]